MAFEFWDDAAALEDGGAAAVCEDLLFEELAFSGRKEVRGGGSLGSSWSS